MRDVSFHIAPGQTLAIVGHTGAGKTTLIQLLLRFYEIQRGQILLDGVDIRRYDVHQLRRQFGIVLQDPFLFTGTLESNVRLGDEDISRARVESALREVGLGSLLDSLPEGVETNVSERGATFSVGQRQLISFARALAHNPRFLILDEATSSVDTKTEILIREALDRLLEGRTALVIAHRLSTIQHADRILVFHKGKLREQGSHQQLLAAARDLLSPVPAPVQRSGAARVLRDGGKRSRHVRSWERLARTGFSLSGLCVSKRAQSRQAEACPTQCPPHKSSSPRAKRPATCTRRGSRRHCARAPTFNSSAWAGRACAMPESNSSPTAPKSPSSESSKSQKNIPP